VDEEVRKKKKKKKRFVDPIHPDKWDKDLLLLPVFFEFFSHFLFSLSIPLLFLPLLSPFDFWLNFVVKFDFLSSIKVE